MTPNTDIFNAAAAYRVIRCTTTGTQSGDGVERTAAETCQIANRLLGSGAQLVQPVTRLRGTELNNREVKPGQQIRSFFQTLGNKVFRSGFGDVSLGEYGIGGMLNHRPLNRAKMLSLAAVPDVIQNGRQISYTESWKDRGYKSYVFAAPVSIGADTVYVAAVVDQRPDNKFYLSEMVDSNGNYVRINENPSGNAKSGITDGAGQTDGAGVTARPERLSMEDAPSNPKNGTDPAPSILDPTVPQGNSGVKGEDMQRGGNRRDRIHKHPDRRRR